jgi:hypothetical protein
MACIGSRKFDVGRFIGKCSNIEDSGRGWAEKLENLSQERTRLQKKAEFG